MSASSHTPDEKSKFMRIFRNLELERRLPKDRLDESIRRFNDWLERWTKQGFITSGQPLAAEGRVFSKSEKRMVKDGSFAEAKEVVGGYVVVRAGNLDEAAGVAEDWPLLDYGASVEVRPVQKFCATLAK